MANKTTNLDIKNDQELMQLVIERNAHALQILYHRYECDIFNFIRRYTGSKELAQDLLQETFIRIWYAAHSFNPKKGAFKNWMFKIALNITRNELSKKQYSYKYFDVYEMHSDDADIIHNTPPDIEVETFELQETIQHALGRLKPFLREIIILKHFQQLRFREIAEITNTPEGTLKSRFHRAIMMLKEFLKEMEK